MSEQQQQQNARALGLMQESDREKFYIDLFKSQMRLKLGEESCGEEKDMIDMFKSLMFSSNDEMKEMRLKLGEEFQTERMNCHIDVEALRNSPEEEDPIETEMIYNIMQRRGKTHYPDLAAQIVRLIVSSANHIIRKGIRLEGILEVCAGNGTHGFAVQKALNDGSTCPDLKGIKYFMTDALIRSRRSDALATVRRLRSGAAVKEYASKTQLLVMIQPPPSSRADLRAILAWEDAHSLSEQPVFMIYFGEMSGAEGSKGTYAYMHKPFTGWSQEFSYTLHTSIDDFGVKVRKDFALFTYKKPHRQALAQEPGVLRCPLSGSAPDAPGVLHLQDHPPDVMKMMDDEQNAEQEASSEGR